MSFSAGVTKSKRRGRCQSRGVDIEDSGGVSGNVGKFDNMSTVLILIVVITVIRSCVIRLRRIVPKTGRLWTRG